MDPGLSRFAGHHFDIDLKVAQRLVADGHDVCVYARKGADAEVMTLLEAVAPTRQLFRMGAYDDPKRLDPIAGDLLLYERATTVLAEDLAQAREADLWLWPSIFASHLNACAAARRGVPVAGCVHTEPEPSVGSISPLLWRHAFLNAKRRGLPLRIGGIEPEHRHAYLPLTAEERFETLPIPHEGKPVAEPRAALRTIGFLGHQRGEKGAGMVPELARLLIEDGFRVVAQDSGGKLRIPDHPSVVKLGYVKDITDAILQCDLVVLPYTPQRYRIKGSGILWESLASGIPVVAPFATAPGNWIEQTGAGTLFTHGTEESIREAVLRARANYPQIAAAAFAASREWPRTHGVGHFIREMIKPVPGGSKS